jgi:voltage-gated potassium channel Kch
MAGYLTLGLVWTMFYMVLSHFSPGAFAPPPGVLDRTSALYFSFITLTTVGYGDISPVSNGARMMAVLEAIFGTFYVAILISRLVALHTANPPSPAGDEGSSRPKP